MTASGHIPFVNVYDNGDCFGIRHYSLVISTVTCANTVAQQIAVATNSIPITHGQGCMESIKNSSRTYQTLKSMALHPNVGNVLFVGLGCEQIEAQALWNDVVASGSQAEYLNIQECGGSPEAVGVGVKKMTTLQTQSGAFERTQRPVSGLVVGVQCGGSDWTTALSGNVVVGAMADRVIAHGGSILLSEVPGLPGSEHILAEQAVNEKVKTDILTMIEELRAKFYALHGHNIEETNPTPGNKAGGITTLVEKSMGNIKKMGTSKIQGVLQLGEAVPYPGLWIVDNRANGPDPVNITGFAMAGAHALVFSTGRGSPVGNPVMPVIKITGNPDSFHKMRSILDFNAGSVFETHSIHEAGKELYELLLSVASGSSTLAEKNKNYEFSIPYDPS